MDETYSKVVSMLSEQLNVDSNRISLESDVIKDLGADSLDVVQMLMTLEDDFGITVSEDEASNLRTVSDIVALIDK
ncbi:MAG: acyl carrier protein [Clostridia bacterium]|nr:acyl carrier protein [Clostridia bacterium]MDY2714247.1 acyl carrier protein [Christensenellaceae bacterium]MDY3723792.1 acyl carrier protein [Christensenellaceae bacterium]